VHRPTLGGRPAATSHAEIERAAFELFAEHGFEATTLDAIAARIGISRRTVTRYYGSKNDIPWGQFDATLDGFASQLSSTPADVPLRQRVHQGVIAFNTFPDDAVPPHRARMRLIFESPTLLAHSMLRYAQWRAVIEAFVADVSGAAPDSSLPRVVGHVSLAQALSAYEQWLSDDGDNAWLRELLDRAMTDLREYLR
jgi:mycofactocin system transcriptional regulator